MPKVKYDAAGGKRERERDIRDARSTSDLVKSGFSTAEVTSP